MKTQLEKDTEALKIARQELEWKEAEVERLGNAVQNGRCSLCNTPLMFDEKIHCGDYPNCEEFMTNDSSKTVTINELADYSNHLQQELAKMKLTINEIEAQKVLPILNWINEQLKKHETLTYDGGLWKGEGYPLTNDNWNKALNQERNMGEYETLLKIKKIIEKC